MRTVRQHHTQPVCSRATRRACWDMGAPTRTGPWVPCQLFMLLMCFQPPLEFMFNKFQTLNTFFRLSFYVLNFVTGNVIPCGSHRPCESSFSFWTLPRVNCVSGTRDPSRPFLALPVLFQIKNFKF